MKDLKLAWTYHTGEKTSLEKGAVDQNTPSQIGDTVFTCTPDGRIAAIDAGFGRGALEVRYPQFFPDLESLPWRGLLQAQGSPG